MIPTLEQLDELRNVVQEAIIYGRNSGRKRSKAAEKRIAKSVAQMTGWDAETVSRALEPLY
jgi:hypothetical protein